MYKLDSTELEKELIKRIAAMHHRIEELEAQLEQAALEKEHLLYLLEKEVVDNGGKV